MLLRSKITAFAVTAALGAGALVLPGADAHASAPQHTAAVVSTAQMTDAQYMEYLSTIDLAAASDAQLAELGMVGQRGADGRVTAVALTPETQRQFQQVAMAYEREARQQSRSMVETGPTTQASFWDWTKCAAALAWFIGTTFIPVGKVGTVAVRAIGIIKRWGIKRTIEVLKRFGRAKDVTEAAFFKDMALALTGIAGLEVCKKAVGL